MKDEPDEMLDLVNDRDEVIGAISRLEFHAKMPDVPGNIRTSDAFIINSRGELWIPRRGDHKMIAPGGLDFSCGEHVMPGEVYLAAAVRGFAEELNTEIKPEDLEPKGVLPPEPGLPIFRGVFIYRSDQAPNYNPKDFTGYEWLLPKEVVRRIESGDKAKRNLLPTIKSVFKQK